ncbi:alcohol dehydrogenase [Ranunculus cassubicifolius]
MISAFECVHDGWGVAVLVGVPNKDDAFKTHPMNLLNVIFSNSLSNRKGEGSKRDANETTPMEFELL